MLKKLIKLLTGAILFLTFLILATLVFLDSIAKAALTSVLRSKTGQDVRIEKVEIGLIRPTFRIENLQLYHPPLAGGGPFVRIQELYVEYDRSAANRRDLHLPLVRINIAEVNIAEDTLGPVNPAALPGVLDQLKVFTNRSPEFRFTGIDILNLSIGTLRKISPKNSAPPYELKLDVRNEVIGPVRTLNDLLAPLTRIVLKASGTSVGKPPNPAAPPRPAPLPRR
ncbi:MAG: hypothetical protein EXS36_04275 [Pedosphaera sp.]|nr:hypothetical protein [Pedosphaera sp.]